MTMTSKKKLLNRQRGPKLEPHQVILAPLVTEKGTHQFTRHNAYPFQVNLWATKTQIKAAVEELFGVRVEKVRTQMRVGKKRRYRFAAIRVSRREDGQKRRHRAVQHLMHARDHLVFARMRARG